MPNITTDEINILLKLKPTIDAILEFETKEPDKTRHPSEYSSCGLVSLRHLNIGEVRKIRNVFISIKDEIDMLEAGKKVAEASKSAAFMSTQDLESLMGNPADTASEKASNGASKAEPPPAPLSVSKLSEVEPVIPRKPEDSLPPRPLKMPEGFSDG